MRVRVAAGFALFGLCNALAPAPGVRQAHGPRRGSVALFASSKRPRNRTPDMYQHYSPGTDYSRNFKKQKDMADDIEAEVVRKSSEHFYSLDTCPALVLNADYQPLSYMPLSLWSWQETIKSVLLGKVNVVAHYNDIFIHTIDEEIPLPSVIALKDYVKPDHKTPAFTRRNLYLRDNYRCAYCARYFYSQELSYDHVMPRFYGGGTNWENVVTCCVDCNGRKGNVHPNKLQDIGMRLLKKPTKPTSYQLQQQARKYPPRLRHSTWESWLGYTSADEDGSSPPGLDLRGKTA
eukprot:CAMPEP_0118858872 /NCGR_PEP_ID=MMETSP1163-20130328/5358_1 /TAXON_ID=124430 /ORGANISM="Phaeomonas parva, Strain CCMP2877" /LENGTH=290 /DNA_ID=CAMNT_0006792375 /DNA_START=159 /DNA_END=1031 /DNA_ORIENTATION=+